MYFIGDRLRARRNELSLTQKELAHALQVSEKTIRNWEGDLSAPDLENIIKLSDRLQCSIDSLVGKDKNNVIYLDGLNYKDVRKIKAIVQTYIDITMKEYRSE